MSRELDKRIAEEVFKEKVIDRAEAVRLSDEWQDSQPPKRLNGIRVPKGPSFASWYAMDWYILDETMLLTGLSPVPRYSTDMNDAWLVVEKLAADGIFCSVHCLVSVRYRCELWDADLNRVKPISDATCESAPEAICQSALAILEKPLAAPQPSL